MPDYSGYIAALGTAFLFSFGSTLFTLSGRVIGSPLVNRARLLVAFCIIVAIHWLTFGQPFPIGGDDVGYRWVWMGISGFVGLVLGDAFLFQGFVMVGPRISMLLMALAPVIGAFLAWIFLGETLDIKDLLAVFLVIGGIAWVISEKTDSKSAGNTVTFSRAYWIGVAFAFGGALGQAGGLVLSKIGLAGDYPALSGNVIRVTVAFISIWAFTLLQGQFLSSFQRLRQQPRATLFLSIGAITGPVSGVWLSLIAVQRAPVGIASTLMALTPIFLIPVSYVVFRDKPSVRALAGTFLAFAGTALFFI